MLKKYLKGKLPEGAGKRSAAAAPAGAKAGNAAEHGGSVLAYAVPVVVLGIALWWQFFRKPESV
jgi:hypothetical protein